MTNTNDGRTPLRHLRVSDELWESAKWAVAIRRDPGLSHIMREALAQYVRETERVHGPAQITDRGATEDDDDDIETA